MEADRSLLRVSGLIPSALALARIIRGKRLALTPGTRLGPYEIQSALGAGGMGEVYKARDTRLDRTVAVKVLPADLAADPDRRARFEREARAIAALSHPHICTIHDVGRHEDIDYLVMEYLDGETLADRLAHAKGRCPGRPCGHAQRFASGLKRHGHGRRLRST